MRKRRGFLARIADAVRVLSLLAAIAAYVLIVGGVSASF